MNKNPTRDEIIQILKDAATEGKQPSHQILKQKGINQYWVAKLVPEGLTSLKLEHGIRVRPQEQHHSRDELLVKIDNVISDLERIPTWKELRDKTGITNKVFIRQFGKRGIPEVFMHYRKWLTEYHPKSKNIKLVDVFLKSQDKSKIQAKSEMQEAISPESSFRYKSHCDHCGNVTYKSQIIAHEVKQDLVEYKLYACEICDHVILRKVSIHFVSNINTEEQEEQLWPPSLIIPQEVPERVRNIYEKARGMKNRWPGSFVVEIRRALEAVMKERNAEGDNLASKINWLIQNKHLPEAFGEMGRLAKDIGNIGAHDDEKDVQPSDADSADDFFRAIIEYIYVAPARVAQVKASIRKM